MAVSLQVQSVIYHNQKESLHRAITSLANAIRVNRDTTKELGEVTVWYGDASSDPIFSNEEVAKIADEFQDYFTFRYKFFGENTGSAKGHNLIGAEGDSEYMMIMNPDVVVCPRFFEMMLKPFADESKKAGMVEARQTPVEHPKEYDKKTFETEWCTTACAIFSRETFNQVNGFDNETFFLYGDDLDFSWRVRLLDKKLYYRPDCVVYHAKGLSAGAKWQPTSAEVYYSMEVALLMAYKWSNKKRFNKLYRMFSNSGAEGKKVIARFEEMKKQGKLPKRLDPEHKVARFVGDLYCDHRFAL